MFESRFNKITKKEIAMKEEMKVIVDRITPSKLDSVDTKLYNEMLSTIMDIVKRREKIVVQLDTLEEFLFIGMEIFIENFKNIQWDTTTKAATEPAIPSTEPRMN